LYCNIILCISSCLCNTIQFKNNQYIIYTIKASPDFLSRIKIYTVQRIVTKFFTVISDSLLEVLVLILLGNMSNIMSFPDFYRNVLFVFKHTILYENETSTWSYSNSMCNFISFIRKNEDNKLYKKSFLSLL